MCIVWRASTPRECHDVLSFSLSRRQPSGEEQQSSGAMAKLQPLKLSDLRSGVDYPVGTDVQERRCLFHVKLTDFSMKSIESLINSDKGAFFSLWFGDGGGTISVPGSKEERKFHFKTSQGDMDGLECVHQAVDSAKQPQLNCWGQVRYKLQVQGTKEVYERTKKLMKETEEQKQKTRTQTISFPHSSSKAGRTKSGGHLGRTGGGRPLVKTSSPFSTPSNPATPHTSSSSSAAPSGSASGTNTGTSFGSKFSGTSTSSGIPPNISKNSGTRKSSKAPHTLRERIIHLLAVKPLKRTDIVNRLKKDTKRGETAMSKTDSLLQEVADIQGEVYCLKQSLFCELRVDDWPFYSEAERQLVKRKHGSSDQYNESLKRSLPVRETPFPKRPKLSHIPTSTAPPPPSQTQPLAQNFERHSPPPPPLPPPPSLKTATNPPFNSNSQMNMPLFGMDSSNSANPSNIEMQSSSHLVRVSSESTKHQELYPGTLVSSLILGSSSTSITSASLVSQQSSLEPSQTGLIVGQTGFGVAGCGGMETSGAPRVPGGGTVFGDLISGNTASEPAQVEPTQTKKEKKKKKNKTKEKILEARSKSDSQSANVRGGVVKTEGEKGGEVEMRSEEGSSGALKVKSEATAEENGASSTTPSTVDFSLLFPPITSDATRNDYKRIFNEEYQEYLDLKGQIEVVTNEVTALSEQLAAVKKGTEEAKVLKRKIREKYTDLQQNHRYQTQKSRFQELHAKLGHIKKLVVEYDQTH